MLHILSDKKRRAFYETNTGREATVLFENDIEEGWMHGFTENYVRIRAKYDPLLVNELKKIRLVGIHDKGGMDVEECSLLLQEKG
jgi:threonylcarbamoyladenosine tRNA methylthiotransferase MtaB